jgi:hypothetical protein
MTIELPAWLLADRAVLLLAGVCALVIEATLLRQPQGVAGVGVVTGAALATWQWFRLRDGRRVRRAQFAADGGWRLDLKDGRAVLARLVPGSRLLGSSAVLRWRVDGRPLAVWLTPVDLPPATLRDLRVRLSGADLRVGT